MIGKKINQLATELAPTTTDLTIIGDPVTGVSKKITLEQLGAIFGGAVSFYTTLGDFPATGVIDIIYCAKDTKKLYLWSGSAYVEVFPSQSLLDTYQLRSEKGVSNGYASLDVNGKVPIGQLPNSIMEYKGTWNAATNTPTLANGTGDTGDVYICNAAGTVNFGAGPITFAVGDYVVYSGTIWQRSSGAVGTVTSVGLSITGDSIGVTGSPITTSGTLALAFAGTGAQYIKGDGTLATFPSIISQAQNLVTEVYNNTGATLSKGTIVYINGGQGNLPTVTKALATGDSTSAQTYGVVQTDITNMNNGYVVVAGRLTDLDTQAYSNGTQLYLSSTTAGTWTSTKQYAPNHLVYVGIVVRSHPTQGVVEIKIQNGYELDELHNVAAQSPDNNDILQYKTATSLWTKVAGTTTNIAEGTNLYYTDARSRAALSFTAGSGAYNSTTGVITIPTNTNQLTNGAAFITLASLSAGAGISYNNTTGVIASTITQYTDALARAAISLTTTGTSGAATYNNTTGVLNIPQYQTALTNPVTGTGTTNYLPKFTGTSTIGNSQVFDNGTNVGVGTASPTTKFEVYSSDLNNIFVTNPDTTGATTGSGIGFKAFNGTSVTQSAGIILTANTWSFGTYSANQLSIGSDGTGGLALRTANSAPISFFTGGTTAGLSTQKMILNASGNLGLGVTPSAWRSTERALQIGATTSVTDISNFAVFRNNNYVNTSGQEIYLTTNGASALVLAPNSEYRFLQAGAGTAGNAISFTQAMTLNASGNLGIGTTSPTSKVHAVNSGNGFIYRFAGGTSSEITGGIFASTAAGFASIGTQSNHTFNIFTNDTDRLSINGSTGAATFSSSVTATSDSTLFKEGYRINATTTGGGGSQPAYTYYTAAGSKRWSHFLNVGDDKFHIANASNSEVFTITQSGSVGIGTTSPTSYGSINTTLSVNNINSGGGGVVETMSNGNSAIRMACSPTDCAIWEPRSVDMLFATANTPRMRITSGGNVGIGTTTIDQKFVVQGPANNWTGNFIGSTTTGQSLGLLVTAGTNASDHAFYVQNSSSTINLFRIAGNGAATFSSTIQTGAPANGTAQPWKLGNAVSGTVSPSHYLVVEINGQSYTINAFNGFP